MLRRLDGKNIPVADLQAALHQATLAGEIVPVLCGATRNRIGVQPLLDAIVAYLPAPTDMPPVLGHNPLNAEEIIERPARSCALHKQTAPA